MAQKIVVNLEQDPADLLEGYGAGAKLYLDSSATQDGVYVNVASEVLLEGVTQYELWDDDGTSATWYKTRVGDSGAVEFSDYSPAQQGGALLAYATLDDLTETMDVTEQRHNLLSDLLIDQSSIVDAACHRQFYRNPQVSGTATFYFDVLRADASLRLATYGLGTTSGQALDIVSITTLRIRRSEREDYETITAGEDGYYLVQGLGPGAAGSVWPYEDIVLSRWCSTFSCFPRGRAAVELTGVMGFARVPNNVKRAVIDMARESYRQGPGGGPSPQGVNQFGVPVYLTGMPASFRQLVAPGSPYVKGGSVV